MKSIEMGFWPRRVRVIGQSPKLIQTLKSHNLIICCRLFDVVPDGSALLLNKLLNYVPCEKKVAPLAESLHKVNLFTFPYLCAII